MNIRRFVMAAALWALVLPLTAAERAAWDDSAQFGVFMHFLPSLDRAEALTDAFDVEALAEQLSAVGADYFVLTMYQNGGWLNAPNAQYDRQTGYAAGERASRRDLIGETANALAKRNIRFFVYLTGQVPNGDARAQRAFGLPEIKADQKITPEFARLWAEVFREWATRYGEKVSGWWIDGCYEWCDFNDDIAAIYQEALRSGNSRAVIAFNPGVKRPEWQTSDYAAGEINDPMDDTAEANTFDGQKQHILTYLGSFWCRPDVRYATERWAARLSEASQRGEAVTIDVAPNTDPAAGKIGTIGTEQFRALQAIRSAAGENREESDKK